MTNGMEILLIEDNPEDVEITLRAFQKHHFANKIHAWIHPPVVGPAI